MFMGFYYGRRRECARGCVRDAVIPLHSEQKTSRGMPLGVMAPVAVGLATNLAARPPRPGTISVGSTGPNSQSRLINFPGRNTAPFGEVSNVCGSDGAGDRRWWRRTRLRSCRAVAEVCAKEHADGPGHGLLSKVDVSLLDGAFEIGVTKLPLDLRFIVADTRVKRPVTGGKHR